MKFTCPAGLHQLKSKAKAANCPKCDPAADLKRARKIRQYFKRQSDAMLQAAGIQPIAEQYGAGHP